MIKRICVTAVVALACAAPALAQKPGDHPARQTSPADAEAIREGLSVIGEGGECTVTFTINSDGKPKDMKPDCTPESYSPYALKAMASVVYDPEIFDGEVWETEDVKQVFRFGTTVAAADPRGEKPPKVVTNLEPKDVQRAISRAGVSGDCEVTYTVGADGVPKDIEPNCDPSKLDNYMRDAFTNMKYEPGEKGGKPTDWPNMSMTLNLPK